MNFGKSFTYMFDDPDWTSKYTLGIVISLVPILNLAWIGYGIGIMRNMAKGMVHPLPVWDNIGEKFKDGLLLALASFIYLIPAWFIFGLASAASFIGNDNGDVSPLGGIFLAVCSCCGFVYLLLFSFLYPAMMIRYARVGTFGSLFQVKEIVQLATQNIGQYLMAWLAGLLAAIILSIVAIIPCLGQLIVIVAGAAWMFTVSSHSYGQVGLSLGEITPEPSAPAY